MKPIARRKSATQSLFSVEMNSSAPDGVVDPERRAQQALAEHLGDLADLRARLVGDVVRRARVKALACLDAQQLLRLALVGVEADVLLELEALLLDEADRIAWPVAIGEEELVLVDDELDLLAQDEDVVLIGVGGHGKRLEPAHPR